MSDNIRVNTEHLNRWAAELSAVAGALSETSSMLARVGTGDEWWTEPRVNQTLRFQDAESSVSLGNARAAVSAMLGTLSKYQDITDELGKAVRKACGLFDDAEVKIDADIEALLSGAAEVISSSSSSQAGAKLTFDQEGWSEYPWRKLIAQLIQDLAGLVDPTKIPKLLIRLTGAIVSIKNIETLFADIVGAVAEFATGSSEVRYFAKNGTTAFIDNFKEVMSGEVTVGEAICEWAVEMMAESGEDLAIKGVKEALKAAGSAVGGPVGLVIATVIGSGLHVTADWIADNTIGNTADIMDAVREGKVTTASGASAGWAY